MAILYAVSAVSAPGITYPAAEPIVSMALFISILPAPKSFTNFLAVRKSPITPTFFASFSIFNPESCALLTVREEIECTSSA